MHCFWILKHSPGTGWRRQTDRKGGFWADARTILFLTFPRQEGTSQTFVVGMCGGQLPWQPILLCLQDRQTDRMTDKPETGSSDRAETDLDMLLLWDLPGSFPTPGRHWWFSWEQNYGSPVSPRTAWTTTGQQPPIQTDLTKPGTGLLPSPLNLLLPDIACLCLLLPLAADSPTFPAYPPTTFHETTGRHFYPYRPAFHSVELTPRQPRDLMEQEGGRGTLFPSDTAGKKGRDPCPGLFASWTGRQPPALLLQT